MPGPVLGTRKQAGNVRDNNCCPLGAHLGGGGGGSHMANSVCLIVRTGRWGPGANLNRVDSCRSKGREEPWEKLGQPERGRNRMDLLANLPYYTPSSTLHSLPPPNPHRRALPSEICLRKQVREIRLPGSSLSFYIFRKISIIES